jgi:hypothetical protein
MSNAERAMKKLGVKPETEGVKTSVAA